MKQQTIHKISIFGIGTPVKKKAKNTEKNGLRFLVIQAKQRGNNRKQKFLAIPKYPATHALE